jgi:glutamine cyclotransferase
MKNILALFLLAISIAFFPACGGSTSETTAQLLNEATVDGASWTAQFSLAGVTLTSTTGVWGPVTKLSNCDTQNGVVVNAPAGYMNTVFGVTITCGAHNLYKLCFDGTNVCMKGGTGDKK